MAGRVRSAPSLAQVRRDYEFSRPQQQLLALAYEHLLPILRPKRRPRATAFRPRTASVAAAAHP